MQKYGISRECRSMEPAEREEVRNYWACVTISIGSVGHDQRNRFDTFVMSKHDEPDALLMTNHNELLAFDITNCIQSQCVPFRLSMVGYDEPFAIWTIGHEQRIQLGMVRHDEPCPLGTVAHEESYWNRKMWQNAFGLQGVLEWLLMSSHNQLLMPYHEQSWPIRCDSSCSILRLCDVSQRFASIGNDQRSESEMIRHRQPGPFKTVRHVQRFANWLPRLIVKQSSLWFKTIAHGERFWINNDCSSLLITNRMKLDTVRHDEHN